MFFTISVNCDIIVRMNEKNNSFTISKKSASDNAGVSKSGHATVATRMSTLSGFDVMDKVVSPNGDLGLMPKLWFYRQKDAARVADMVRQKNNPAYTVPHTFVSHGHVRDEFVPGVAAADLPSTYTIEHKSELITAIGQFVNDMSELFPIRRYSPERFADVTMMSVDVLDRMMNVCALSPISRAKIRNIFEYLRDLPENQEMVFVHNDLNGANVLVDVDTGRVGIIDFELAEFQPKTTIMYSQLPYPKLWEYVNKLPRTTNTDLYWNYDPDIYTLFRFMQWAISEMQNLLTDFNAKKINQVHKNIAFQLVNISEIFMHAKRFHKLNTRESPAPVVPIAHYNKDMDL